MTLPHVDGVPDDGLDLESVKVNGVFQGNAFESESCQSSTPRPACGSSGVRLGRMYRCPESSTPVAREAGTRALRRRLRRRDRVRACRHVKEPVRVIALAEAVAVETERHNDQSAVHLIGELVSLGVLL